MTAIEWRQLTVPDAAAWAVWLGKHHPAEKCDNAGISGG